MYATPDQFAASGKSGIEALTGFAEVQFGTIERIAQLNLGTIREGFKESSEHFKSLLDAKDPTEMLKLSVGYAQPVFGKAVAYGRSLYEVAAETQSTVTKLVEANAAELNKGLATLIDTISKNAPAGSEPTVAALKNSLATFNSACDNFSRLVKQAAEVVEVSLDNLANATKTKPSKTAAAS